MLDPGIARLDIYKFIRIVVIFVTIQKVIYLLNYIQTIEYMNIECDENHTYS